MTEQYQWIRVDDRLPPPDTEVLGVTVIHEMQSDGSFSLEGYVDLFEYASHFGWSRTPYEAGGPDNVLAWMPKPVCDVLELFGRDGAGMPTGMTSRDPYPIRRGLHCRCETHYGLSRIVLVSDDRGVLGQFRYCEGGVAAVELAGFSCKSVAHQDGWREHIEL